MKAAIFSDIHGNSPALCSALRDAQRKGAQQFIIAGDMIGRGPNPLEVVRLIAAMKYPAIYGNMERKLLRYRDGGESMQKRENHFAWTARQLGDQEWAYIASLLPELELDIEGFRLLIVHGSPVSDVDSIYSSITGDDLRSRLGGRDPNILVCGHTHIPFIKTLEGIRVVNCGAVGMPVDDEDPRGSYAILDLEAGRTPRCRIVRFSYSYADVARDLELRGVPNVKSMFVRVLDDHRGGENRYYAVPAGNAGNSLQRILDKLELIGYQLNPSETRRQTREYYDTQDGKLLDRGLQLYRCSPADDIAKNDRTHDASVLPSREGLVREAVRWQLLSRGNLFLTQVADGDGPPVIGPVAEYLHSVVAVNTLLPYVKARLSEQFIETTPPYQAGAMKMPGGAGGGQGEYSGQPSGLFYQTWDFKSPFHGGWRGKRNLIAIKENEVYGETGLLASMIRDYTGLRPAIFDPLSAGTKAIGTAAPGSPVPAEYLLRSDDSVYTAIGKIVGKQCIKMRGNTMGTVQDLDPEFLHDLRVATRRARFALNLFREYIGDQECGRCSRELSWIAKSLGRVRDIDVFLDKFVVQFKKTGATYAVFELVSEHYSRRRERNLSKVREDLASGRYKDLLLSLDKMKTAMLERGRDEGIAVVDLIPGFIGAALDRIGLWLNKPVEAFTADDLHELRIEFKGLRYTTEFFSELYGRDMKNVIRGFVQFQDCLGLHQDAQVAGDTLRKFSTKQLKRGQPDVDVMLSTGALIQVQREVQEKQRARFLKMWVRFPGRMKEMQKILRSGRFYRPV